MYAVEPVYQRASHEVPQDSGIKIGRTDPKLDPKVRRL
jgi:hypothetical protein